MIVDNNVTLSMDVCTPLVLKCLQTIQKSNYYFRRTNITPWAPIIFMHCLLLLTGCFAFVLSFFIYIISFVYFFIFNPSFCCIFVVVNKKSSVITHKCEKLTKIKNRTRLHKSMFKYSNIELII